MFELLFIHSGALRGGERTPQVRSLNPAERYSQPRASLIFSAHRLPSVTCVMGLR
jgi:hypothetical protein